jgi:DNA-binding FadR family transcriptional regulator
VADRATLSRYDIAFHDAIAHACHNALFVQIVSSFGPLMQVAVPAAWGTRTTERQRQSIIDNHLALARAIADGDPQRAAAEMDAHFDASVGDLLRSMDDGERHDR